MRISKTRLKIVHLKSHPDISGTKSLKVGEIGRAVHISRRAGLFTQCDRSKTSRADSWRWSPDQVLIHGSIYWSPREYILVYILILSFLLGPNPAVVGDTASSVVNTMVGHFAGKSLKLALFLGLLLTIGESQLCNDTAGNENEVSYIFSILYCSFLYLFGGLGAPIPKRIPCSCPFLRKKVVIFQWEARIREIKKKG